MNFGAQGRLKLHEMSENKRLIPQWAHVLKEFVRIGMIQGVQDSLRVSDHRARQHSYFQLRELL